MKLLTLFGCRQGDCKDEQGLLSTAPISLTITAFIFDRKVCRKTCSFSKKGLRDFKGKRILCIVFSLGKCFIMKCTMQKWQCVQSDRTLALMTLPLISCEILFYVRKSGVLLHSPGWMLEVEPVQSMCVSYNHASCSPCEALCTLYCSSGNSSLRLCA